MAGSVALASLWAPEVELVDVDDGILKVWVRSGVRGVTYCVAPKAGG
jgi:hypothetical protein